MDEKCVDESVTIQDQDVHFQVLSDMKMLEMSSKNVVRQENVITMDNSISTSNEVTNDVNKIIIN